jgi:iron(III) transport system permease protein
VLAGVAVGALVCFLVGVPLGVLAFSSVRDTAARLPFDDTSFTLANYATVFSTPATYSLLGNTLLYAAGTLAISLALGGGFAWFLQRVEVACRALLTLCVLSAMATPPVTDAIAWSLLANPSIGLLNAAIRAATGGSGDGPLNVYTIGGMAFVTGIKMVPTAFILLSGPIARFDPLLAEAATVSGAGAWQTLRRITMPLLRPATLGLLVLFALLVLETFEIPAVLGLPGRVFVFSTLIYNASHPPIGLPNYGLVSAYAGVFLVAAAALLAMYNRATARSEAFAVVTGKGYRARRVSLGPLAHVLTAVVVLYFVVAVALPLLSLLWTSLGLSYYSTELASLANASLGSYGALVLTPNLQRAVANTAVVAALSATGAMLLASAVAWLAIRHNSPAARLPDRLTLAVVAAPSIVVGLALLAFYAWLPLPIYGTIWIITIGLATRFLGYTTRLMSASLVQVHRELSEAAASSGASGWDVARRVILPLVWPAFSGGWVWVFVHALRDATLTLMLFTVANDTLAVRLWSLWFNEGKPAQAAALAVCLALVSGLLSAGMIRTTLVQPHAG